MNISSISSPAASPIRSMPMGEASEGPGPDNDGDADDVGKAGAGSTAAKAPLPQGVGQTVDVMA